VSQLPLVIRLHQDSADKPDDRGLIREDPHDISAALHLFVEALQAVGGVEAEATSGKATSCSALHQKPFGFQSLVGMQE
jgi:hypothetical protein